MFLVEWNEICFGIFYKVTYIVPKTCLYIYKWCWENLKLKEKLSFQTKKPIERTRNMKPIEEPKASPPPPVEEPVPAEESEANKSVFLSYN